MCILWFQCGFPWCNHITDYFTCPSSLPWLEWGMEGVGSKSHCWFPHGDSSRKLRADEHGDMLWDKSSGEHQRGSNKPSGSEKHCWAKMMVEIVLGKQKELMSMLAPMRRRQQHWKYSKVLTSKSKEVFSFISNGFSKQRIRRHFLLSVETVFRVGLFFFSLSLQLLLIWGPHNCSAWHHRSQCTTISWHLLYGIELTNISCMQDRGVLPGSHIASSTFL